MSWQSRGHISCFIDITLSLSHSKCTSVSHFSPLAQLTSIDCSQCTLELASPILGNRVMLAQHISFSFTFKRLQLGRRVGRHFALFWSILQYL